jgi:hypothetical protein
MPGLYKRRSIAVEGSFCGMREIMCSIPSTSFFSLIHAEMLPRMYLYPWIIFYSLDMHADACCRAFSPPDHGALAILWSVGRTSRSVRPLEMLRG